MLLIIFIGSFIATIVFSFLSMYHKRKNMFEKLQYSFTSCVVFSMVAFMSIMIYAMLSSEIPFEKKTDETNTEKYTLTQQTFSYGNDDENSKSYILKESEDGSYEFKCENEDKKEFTIGDITKDNIIINYINDDETPYVIEHTYNCVPENDVLRLLLCSDKKYLKTYDVFVPSNQIISFNN